jgi:galactitol-specific phosphotransferase system IIB component
MGKIAIEPGLTPVQDYLKNQGYEVESVNLGRSNSVNLNSYDAFIITGQSSNFMGDEKTQTSAAVINATGMTPEDVLKALRQQTNHSMRDFRL